MSIQNLFERSNRLAVIGFLFDLPAFIIVSIGLLQNLSGIEDIGERVGLTPQSLITHPILVVGGMLLAIGLNVIPIFRIRIEPQQGTLVTTISTELKFFNLAVLGLSLFLFCSILGYAFVENFRVVPR